MCFVHVVLVQVPAPGHMDHLLVLLAGGIGLFRVELFRALRHAHRHVRAGTTLLEHPGGSAEEKACRTYHKNGGKDGIRTQDDVISLKTTQGDSKKRKSFVKGFTVDSDPQV